MAVSPFPGCFPTFDHQLPLLCGRVLLAEAVYRRTGLAAPVHTPEVPLSAAPSRYSYRFRTSSSADHAAGN